MFLISSVIQRLRSKADFPIDAKDTLIQDGTQYTVPLSFKPVISGSEQVFINSATFTTGFNQFVPQNNTQSPAYANGFNLVYGMNYSRGELNFYQGSGYLINSTGLMPFAPWANSNVIVYYQYSKYTDKTLADYISFAVASVEMSLQLGMYVSGISGVAPNPRQYTDDVDYRTNTPPYGLDEKYVIAEDVEILQELIAKKASWDIAMRERRVGAGNAIKLKDGDTEIDTSANQRYVASYTQDLKKEYDDLLKFIQMNMMEGYTLKQINEVSSRIFLFANSSSIDLANGIPFYF